MNYQEARSYLDQLQFFKIKLGLEAINELLGELGSPQNAFPCIHLAGTNGKGSVGATLLSVLTEAGYKVGFYSSPHLSSVRERFIIGNQYISKEQFSSHAETIVTCLGNRQITYFEFTTALAFLWFNQEQVDLVILETGLGGRLDATNIVTPLVSVITNISLDHQQYLGDTIPEIAREKAGIIKHSIPTVSAVTDIESQPIIEKTCQSLHSKLYQYGRDFQGVFDQNRRLEYQAPSGAAKNDLPVTLAGSYQAVNTSVALATLEIIEDQFPVDAKTLRQGLEKVRWPGRMEKLTIEHNGDNYTFLIDGAHNIAGVAALQQTLEEEYNGKKLFLIWGAMADKTIKDSLNSLLPLAEKIILTQAEPERSATAESLFNQLAEPAQNKATCVTPVESALEKAMELATPQDIICVAGSLYLVGKTRHILMGDLVEEA